MSGHPRSAAEALMRAAESFRASRGVRIDGDYYAQILADAALSYYDDMCQVRQQAHHCQWDQPEFRDYLRQHMRHELLDGITRNGLLPVALPHETVRFMGGSFLEGEREVPESAEWQTVIVTLEAPVRKPPVNREAAVKAGILPGQEAAS